MSVCVCVCTCVAITPLCAGGVTAGFAGLRLSAVMSSSVGEAETPADETTLEAQWLQMTQRWPKSDHSVEHTLQHPTL